MDSNHSLHALVTSALMLAAAVASAQSPRPTPPPEPSVKPIVSAPADADVNQTRVDDRIETSVTLARATLATRDASSTEAAAAKQQLQEPVRVELIFSQQITQAQIDAFLKAGGTIDKIFTHVSYGWTGTISREAAADLPAAMGPTLLGVVQAKEAKLFMDEAGRNSRVRPTVWNLGIDGVDVGVNRTTIAIIDSGVDGTHTDLAGRMVYWKDWTSNNHASSQDLGHHGTHVAGIATGTGAASPAGSTSIKFTANGKMPSAPNNFFPNPFRMPAAVPIISWQSNLHWASGGGNNAVAGLAVINNAGGFELLKNTLPTSTSPIPVSSVGEFFNPPAAGYTSRYSPFVTKATMNATEPSYAMTNTVSYVGPTDGYNIFRGVAPGSSWAGFKVFEDDGDGFADDIGEAIDDLVAVNAANPSYRIKVANMSLGITDQEGDNYGLSTVVRNKTNTAAQNGIVMVVAAGNSGRATIPGGRQLGDPGRAQYAITVAASSDVNQLTDYSSHGFVAPGDVFGGDEDIKPDITAPGGSQGFQTNIMSVDSNTADSTDNTAAVLPDAVANDYYNIQGTSMAAPHIAGVAALLIDAMQQSGESWDFSGPGALADVLRVKMLMLMTATETNKLREQGPSLNPSVNRGAKDTAEGYGMVNADAAVEALLNPALDPSPAIQGATFGAGDHDRRCWARRINLTAGSSVLTNLDVPLTGDFDVYIYGATPDAYGNPQILASSTIGGSGADEALSYVPLSTQTGYIVVKKVSGSGIWSMTTPSSVDAWTLY